MCGIAGYFGVQSPSEDLIQEGLRTMKQRGPDAQSYHIASTPKVSATLLHSRLSIIDLDPRSNQPFVRDGMTLVFNGEIYNYVELRARLEQDGVELTTNSDTEVLLEYFRKYEEFCVEHFEGMWAFALFNQKTGKLYLSRDRFGEKPLYLLRKPHGIYFASEVKTIEAMSGERLDVNSSHLMRYMINGHKSLYKSGEHFFNGIEEVDISTIVHMSHDLRMKEYRYWSPAYRPDSSMKMQDAVEGARHHLTESVKLRLRSDVPLAFCLSGGVDSASLVSIASKVLNAKVNTFSIIDRDHRYDEFDNIEATVRDTGCMSTKIILEPGDSNITRLEDLIRYHDAPIATISYFVHSMLSEAISGAGYKISISGTGADEMFTGYYDHFIMHLYEMRDTPELPKLKKEWETHVLQYVRHPDFRKWDYFIEDHKRRSHVYLNNEEFRKLMKVDFKEEFTERTYCSSLLRNRMMNEMFEEVVRVILHEDDLNSMKYSVENRSPFLDKNLFEFAYTIPNRFLIQDGYNKYVLREAMNGILNDQVRLSREKKGFNASINSIFDFSNPKHVDYFLADSEIFEWFDKDRIADVLRRREFTNSWKKFLFDFICAKIFLDQRRLN